MKILLRLSCAMQDGVLTLSVAFLGESMPKHFTSFSRYHNLWKVSQQGSAKVPHQQRDDLDLSIDKICLRADLCENYESYIHVLGEGMIELLESGVTRRRLLKHPYLYEKLMQLGDVILDKSYFESDQFYVGLFVALRIKGNWLKAKFYRLILNMLHQVLDQGLKISKHLKEKILTQLEQENVALFHQYFRSAKYARTF